MSGDQRDNEGVSGTMIDSGDVTAMASFAEQVADVPLRVYSSKWPEDPDDNMSRLLQAYRSWTYSYMGLILTKGSRQTTSKDRFEKMSQQDLYTVPYSMRSSYLSTQFKKHFHEIGVADISTVGTKKRLVQTFWRLAAPTFIPAGFCELLTVVCQVAMPLLVRELLHVLEENPKSQVVAKGMPCKLACCGFAV